MGLHMNKEYQTLLAEVSAMLVKAKDLNENGQYGEALKLAHYASECVAVAYLLATTGKRLPPNDATFETFSDTIQETNRHPDFKSKIEDVVGDVYVLREAYEPALLDETTLKDAQQMIDHVAALVELAEAVVK